MNKRGRSVRVDLSKVDQDYLPVQTETYDIGSSSKRIKTVHVKDIELSGEIKQGGLSNSVNFSTGVISGGVLSPNSPPDGKFNISGGSGVVNVGGNSPTQVSWATFTDVVSTYIATDLISWISLSSAGVVIQRNSKLSSTDRRNEIFLGVIVHTDNSTVSVVNNEQDVATTPISQWRDLADAVGFLNLSGNTLSAVSGLDIKKSSGVMWAAGSNYHNDVNDPHKIVLPAIDTSSGGLFEYRTSNGVNTTPLASEFDTTKWESPLGTVTATSSNRFYVTRVYSFTSNNMKAQYPQVEYKTHDEAVSSATTEEFSTEPSIQANGMLIGYIVFKGNSVDLTLPTESHFLRAEKFGGATGAIAGSSLQTAYENNSLIVTHDSEGALTIQNGQTGADNATYQLVIKDKLGNVRFDIRGDGDLTCANLTGQAILADSINAPSSAQTLYIGQAPTGDLELGNPSYNTNMKGNVFFEQEIPSAFNWTYPLQTFSPVIEDDSANAFTMNATATCKYFEMGNRVYIWIRARWNSKGSASGEIRCTLPHVVAPQDDCPNALTVGYIENIAYTNQLIVNTANAGGAYFKFYSNGNGTSSAPSVLSDTSFGSTGRIKVAGWYCT